MRVAVTGGTGFVGSHLVRALAENGNEVVAIARGTRRLPRRDGVTFVRRDLTQPDGLADVFSGVDAVIHLPAVINERGRQTFERVNRGTAEHVAAAAADAHVPHVILQSAIGADPDPTYPYLASKWAAEEAVRGTVPGWTIIRPSLIFGPGDGFFTTIARLVRLNPVVPIAGDGNALFQPIAVDDVVRCHLIALERGPSSRTHEIGGPDHLTYEAIVLTVKRAMGAHRKLVHVPVRMLVPPAFVMSKLLRKPPVTPQQLRLLDKNNITSLNAVPAQYGFEPDPFTPDTAEYLQDY